MTKNNTKISPKNISFQDTQVAFTTKSDKELAQTHQLFWLMNYPVLVNWGTAFTKLALNLQLPISGLLKHTIFKQFCGGESIQDCEKVIRQMTQFGVGTILDYSVEGEKTDAAFDATVRETIATIQKSAHDEGVPFSVFKVTGLAPFEVLENVSNSIREKTDLSENDQIAFAKVRVRVHEICRIAYENDVRILIDAEETWIQEAIDKLVKEMMLKFNRENPIVFNTFQLYTQTALASLKEFYVFCTENQLYLGAKLVRGAYMEKERERAKKLNYPDPIQPDKTHSDHDFNQALEFCAEYWEKIAVCCASHNEKSNLLLTKLMAQYDIPNNHSHFWFAQLYGMSDNISYNLAQAGYNVAKYLPYGPVKVVMPYLFRRASENTSIAGQTSREFRLVRQEMQRRKEQR